MNPQPELLAYLTCLMEGGPDLINNEERILGALVDMLNRERAFLTRLQSFPDQPQSLSVILGEHCYHPANTHYFGYNS